MKDPLWHWEFGKVLIGSIEDNWLEHEAYANLSPLWSCESRQRLPLLPMCREPLRYRRKRSRVRIDFGCREVALPKARHSRQPPTDCFMARHVLRQNGPTESSLLRPFFGVRRDGTRCFPRLSDYSKAQDLVETDDERKTRTGGVETVVSLVDCLL